MKIPDLILPECSAYGRIMFTNNSKLKCMDYGAIYNHVQVLRIRDVLSMSEYFSSRILNKKDRYRYRYHTIPVTTGTGTFFFQLTVFKSTS
jgi:hypothetical protein